MEKKLFYKIFIFFAFVFLVQIFISLIQNDFHFAYALDDPYIHMAIAKNFAQHFVWGVSKYEFSSSSSSILYTLLISLFYFIGLKSVFIPLLLNIISLGLFAYALISILKYLELEHKFIFPSIIIIGILTPIVALMLTGMEHIAHISVVILLLINTLKYFKKHKRNDLIKLLILAFISVGLRFESLFIIFALDLILLFKKDIKSFLLISLFSTLPVIIFGLISLANGSYFLPNSLLIKGIIPQNNINSIINQSILWLKRTITYPHLLSSILITIFGIIYSIKLNRKKLHYLSIIVLISWILHLTFAGVGWFYRYEAYLVALSLIILATILNEIIHNSTNFLSIKSSIIIIIILLLPFTYRLVSSIYKSTFAMQNIFNQQVKMANYIKEKDYKSVILNDIGAVCYYNNLQIIDVLGLGSIEVVQYIKQDNYNTNNLIELSKKKKSEIAMLYKNILNFKLPDNWQLIDSIKIQNNVVCWDDIVYIYDVKNYSD